jgi:hypothetical protein
MSQTKLNYVIDSISAIIGDTLNSVYSKSEIVNQINPIRQKIYDDKLLAATGFKSPRAKDIEFFTKLFPEWLGVTRYHIKTITFVDTVNTVTTDKPHLLKTGDKVFITNVTGFDTNPNGYFLIYEVTEKTFKIDNDTSSGSYGGYGYVMNAVENNDISLPSDCRIILTGLLNASTPAISNAIVKPVQPSLIHDAENNSFSAVYASLTEPRIYKSDSIAKVLCGQGIAEGNVILTYLKEPIPVTLGESYEDIPDPEGWLIDIINFTSELILSFQQL